MCEEGHKKILREKTSSGSGELIQENCWGARELARDGASGVGRLRSRPYTELLPFLQQRVV
jgi:hypothetical protein